MNRRARIQRSTRETHLDITLDLDGQGQSRVATGLGFFDHMLDQLAAHGLLDLEINASGDLHVDGHHTVEDTGIALGQALRSALGERRGIRRFGAAMVPLDESLSRVVVDLSNRPTLVWRVTLPVQKIGGFDTELFKEFFAALAANAGMTLHVENFYGDNAHHIIESVFKAMARALREACEPDPRRGDAPPSTKGTLSL
ncbi:MAG: imidazoleglycerol-phosphate dehydratase HisB [Magnetococcus sp. WYHC-3]